MRVKISFLLLFAILVLIGTGCTTGNVGNSFYLAGTINVNTQTMTTVYIAFYKGGCKITYDSEGNVSTLENFSVVGSIIAFNVLSSASFQIVIPEPYDSIGGVLAWIDNNENHLPDPSFEQVILMKRMINNKPSIIIGIVYDPSNKNFLVNYENQDGTFQQYFAIIGNDNYQYNF